MKRIFFFIFSISLVTLFSCNFSKGVKKDLSTGLAASYNGFAIDDIYLTDASGTRLNNNKIVMGSKIAIVATGVDYFETKDGKAFPGCRIILTDKNKKEVRIRRLKFFHVRLDFVQRRTDFPRAKPRDDRLQGRAFYIN